VFTHLHPLSFNSFATSQWRCSKKHVFDPLLAVLWRSQGSKLNTMKRPLICNVSCKTRWCLLSTQAHSLKTLPACLSSTLELRKRARRSAGLSWLGSPAVRGEKPVCASQGPESVFAHRKEIKEFGQLFPAECQENLRTYVAVLCPQNNLGRHKYLCLSNCLISLA